MLALSAGVDLCRSGRLVETGNGHDDDNAEPADDRADAGKVLAASLARARLAKGGDAADKTERGEAEKRSDEAGDCERTHGHHTGLCT